MFRFLTSKVAESSVTEKVSEVVSEVSTTITEVASEVSTKATEVATDVSTTSAGIQLDFTTANMSTALLWFVTGMIGVFAVIGVIILSVSVLNKIGAKKDK